MKQLELPMIGRLDGPSVVHPEYIKGLTYRQAV